MVNTSGRVMLSRSTIELKAALALASALRRLGASIYYRIERILGIGIGIGLGFMLVDLL